MIGGVKLFPWLSLLLWALGNTSSAFYFPSIQPPANTVQPPIIKMTYYPSPTETNKEIYNIPNSGWNSKKWNWGSAQGTGMSSLGFGPFCFYFTLQANRSTLMFLLKVTIVQLSVDAVGVIAKIDKSWCSRC